MPTVDDYNLRKLKKEDLELVLSWRNQERIRSNMYTDHIISPEEHQAWYQRIKSDPNSVYLVFEYQKRPAGLVSFTYIDRLNSKCMWGFYIAETELPRGSGTVMGYLALNHIFEVEKLRKVSGEVLDLNKPSRKFFERLGFSNEGTLRQHVKKNGKYIDVILYSQLANEWTEREKSRVEMTLFPENPEVTKPRKKILFLGPFSERLISYLQDQGHEVVTTKKKLTAKSRILSDVEFLISYGYRYIIKEDIIRLFPRKIVNLHISFLPWNRGADPNPWSFLEDTPMGVTIHYIDAGVDTGDILAQQSIDYEEDDTLRSSYDRLRLTIEDLFIKIWPDIYSRRQPAFKQTGQGTFHLRCDLEQYEHLLHRGWDTPVADLIGQALSQTGGKSL
jgi:methionyl-tRNA formyltransferase